MKPLTAFHRTLGIVAVLPLAFMAWTGTWMVVLRSAQPLLAPPPHRVRTTAPLRSVDAIVAAAAAASEHGAKATSYSPPPTADGYATVALGGRDRTPTLVLVDPQTLAVRPSNDWVSPVYDVLHRVHENLFAGGVGKAIVGVFGIALLALVVAGVPLWFRPARTARGEPFALRRGWLRVHGVVGAWLFVVVAFTAATGTIMAYPIVGATVRAIGATPTDPGCRVRAGGAPNVQAAIDASLRAVPGTTLVSVQLGRGPLRITRALPGFARGAPAIVVSVVGGTVACVTDPRTAGFGSLANAWIRPLHSGQGATLAWTAIIFLSGIAVLAFVVTGTVMRVRRTSGVRRTRVSS